MPRFAERVSCDLALSYGHAKVGNPMPSREIGSVRECRVDVAALLSGVVGIAGSIPRPVKAHKRLKDQSES
jgi:hypothetical protein